MANARAEPDSFDALLQAYQHVLVLAGKAFRSNPGAHKQLYAPDTSLRTMMAKTMSGYHHALNDIESEINRSQEVLLRDWERFHPPPQPIATSTKDEEQADANMTAPSTAAHTVNAETGVQNTNQNKPKMESNLAAPFPDMGLEMRMGMGMGMGMGVPNDLPVGSKKTPQVSPRTAPKAGVGRGAGANKKTKASNATPKTTQAPLPRPSSQGAPAAPSVAQRTPTPLDNYLAMVQSVQTNGSSQNAPPAPMPEFDVGALQRQMSNSAVNNGLAPTTSNFQNLGGAGKQAAPAARSMPASKQPKSGARKPDGMYQLGHSNTSDNMVLDLSLGDSSGSFDDMFMGSKGDEDGMGQFDTNFFGMN